MKIEFIAKNVKNGPVADFVLKFEHELTGWQLRGGAVWKSRKKDQDFYVTLPDRKYTDRNGESKTYPLLAPNSQGVDGVQMKERLEQAVLDAYRRFVSA